MARDPEARSPLAWSVTRQRTFERCRRMYWLRYYGGRGGWRGDAPPEVRLAYALGKLVTLPVALGSVVHEIAREFTLAVRDGGPIPELGEVRQRVRAELNGLVLSSRDPQAFLRDPRGNRMLQEMWHGGAIAPEQAAQVSRRIDLSTSGLVRSRLWRDLRTVSPDAIQRIDSVELHNVQGVPMYAAPDVAYLQRDDAGVVVDFKVGAGGREEEQREQVAAYALVLRNLLGVEAPERWRGRILLLESETEIEYDLTEEDLSHALRRIHEGHAAMEALLLDPDRNEPRPREAFPLTRRRAQCPRCPFWAICEEEVRSRGVMAQLQSEPWARPVLLAQDPRGGANGDACI